MPTSDGDEDAKKKKTTPYGAIIPAIIVAQFILPAPTSIWTWLLYFAILIVPFLLSGARSR